MSLMGFLMAVSRQLIERTNGAVSGHNFPNYVLIDMYDEGYSVTRACDALLARIEGKD